MSCYESDSDALHCWGCHSKVYVIVVCFVMCNALMMIFCLVVFCHVNLLTGPLGLVWLCRSKDCHGRHDARCNRSKKIALMMIDAQIR